MNGPLEADEKPDQAKMEQGKGKKIHGPQKTDVGTGVARGGHGPAVTTEG